MKKLEIKPGDTYGRLTIIKEIAPHVFPSGERKRKVLCQCSCENKTIVEVQLSNLRGRNTTSCGCWKKEGIIKRSSTHGLKHHSLYPVWKNMKNRCSDKNHKNYGGRGISVCSEWRKDFKEFYEFAMSNGWKQGLEIDRIDNDKGYSPDNCRFATRSENQSNKRAYGKIPYYGVCFNKRDKKYVASVWVEGKKIYLGLYETAELAARAYDEYVIVNKLDKQLNFKKGENDE